MRFMFYRAQPLMLNVFVLYKCFFSSYHLFRLHFFPLVSSLTVFTHFSLLPYFIPLFIHSSIFFSPIHPLGVFFSVNHYKNVQAHLHSSHMLPLLPSFVQMNVINLQGGGWRYAAYISWQRAQTAKQMFTFFSMENNGLHLIELQGEQNILHAMTRAENRYLKVKHSCCIFELFEY